MFFSKMFKKDHGHYLEKAKKYMLAERYADARLALQDSLAALKGSDGAVEAEINSLFRKAGDRLAQLNIAEAEAQLRAGLEDKAREHLKLAIELADDVTLREKAMQLSKNTVEAPVPKAAHTHKSGCSGCGTSGAHHDVTPVETMENLSSEDMYDLLTRPLPGDLHERYVEMGKEFAEAYLAAHSGDIAKASAVYAKLCSEGGNDIVHYELAVLYHKSKQSQVSEELLVKSLSLNADNPLSNMALAELLAETGRLELAVQLLTSMRERSILPEQSTVMLGDIYEALGNDQAAITMYSELLNSSHKKEVAQRLIPLLDRNGRRGEAEHLFKTCMKGCC